MSFGFNRYAIVLLAFTATAGLSGCSGGSSNKGAASTVAASNSSSSAAQTTSSSAALGSGPALTSVRFDDVNADGMVGKGDKLVIRFDNDVERLASTTKDPADELTLAVAGDTFGTNATLQAAVSGNANEIDVVLGDNPVIRVSDTFDIAKTTPGNSSAVNVAFTATLRGFDAGTVRAAAAPMDIDGNLPAGFHAAGSLNDARGAHASVELDDGRVLVVGGAAAKGRSGYTGEPELFDPMTGTFTRVSALSGDAGLMKNGKVVVRQTAPAAVKLNDGTVLVCGGFGIEKKGLFGFGKDKEDTLKSAFIFDPSTNSFRKVGDMKYPRHSFSATIMDDGRVMIAGGYNDSWWSKHKTQAPFEIYDPSKGEFNKEGSFFSRFKSKESRMNHTATAIENGTGILLTGGNYYKGGYLFGLIKPKLQMTKGAEVVRGTTTESTADLNQARMRHSAAAVTPREVLVAGGHDPSQIHSSLELFDSSTASWASKGNLNVARVGATIATDKNLALIIGGTNGTAETDVVEVYDADAKALSTTTYKLTNARNGHTATKLKDGRIMVIGGFTGATSYDGLDGQPIADCEVFVRQ